LNACAVSYIDENGKQRVIGLVNLKLDRPVDSPMIAGDEISVTNIGVMYSSSPLYHGLSIGYTQESSVILKNNVLVIVEGDEGLDVIK